jgi:Protein of unknown function (DUF4239)
LEPLGGEVDLMLETLTTLVYAIPAWLGFLLIVAVSAALACGGHVVVRRSFPRADFIEHNEVAGFIFAVVGVLFAVLLAFLTVIVWENFAQAEQRAQSEVDAATDVWRLSRHLPSPDAGRLRADLGRYTEAVIAQEWPEMRQGRSSAQTQRLMVALIDDVAGMNASNLHQATLETAVLERVQRMADFRRRRIYDNQSGIPALLWLGLLVGVCTVIAFVYLFGMKDFRVQLLMTAATGIIIGVSFGLILELDYPFRGGVSITPERWIILRDIIAHEQGCRSCVVVPARGRCGDRQVPRHIGLVQPRHGRVRPDP